MALELHRPDLDDGIPVFVESGRFNVNGYDLVHRTSVSHIKQGTIPELVFTSEPIDLAALLFSKAGKVESIA